MVERLSFGSLNATRGAKTGGTRPRMASELTPEDLAARQKSNDELKALAAAEQAKAPAYAPTPQAPAAGAGGERINFQSNNPRGTTKSSPPMLPGAGGMDEAPRYAPEGYQNPMAGAQQQWLAHKQDPSYGMTEKTVRHYIDQAMAGPQAMGRIAHGELDPMSPEGIHAGMSAAWSLPMQSPFVPKGSAGVGGGRLTQPHFEPNQYGSSPHKYTPGANENVPGGGKGAGQWDLDASLAKLNSVLGEEARRLPPPSEPERYMHSPFATREGELARYSQPPAGTTPPPARDPYPPPPPGEATARYAPDAPFLATERMTVPGQETAKHQEGLQGILQSLWGKTARDNFGQHLTPRYFGGDRT